MLDYQQVWIAGAKCLVQADALEKAMTKLLEDLAEVVRLRNITEEANVYGTSEEFSAADRKHADASARYLAEHHATITDMAKRLAALEQALEEKADNHEYFRDGAGYGVDRIKDRADELMREWTEGVG